MTRKPSEMSPFYTRLCVLHGVASAFPRGSFTFQPDTVLSTRLLLALESLPEVGEHTPNDTVTS